MDDGRGFWQRNGGKVTGAIVGAGVALLIKWLGFGWTVLVIVLAWLGMQVGARLDEGAWTWPEPWERWWHRWLRRPQ